MKLQYKGSMKTEFVGVLKPRSWTEGEKALYNAILKKRNIVGQLKWWFAAVLVTDPNTHISALLEEENNLKYMNFRKFLLDPYGQSWRELEMLENKGKTLLKVIDKLPNLLVSGDVSPELGVMLDRSLKCFSLYENDYLFNIIRGRLVEHRKYCIVKDESVIINLRAKLKHKLSEIQICHH